ncbi:MAG: hypothetical protein ABSF26_02740 [Thermoguttaceae bacterium]|jgi:hypothetical protein
MTKVTDDLDPMQQRVDAAVERWKAAGRRVKELKERQANELEIAAAAAEETHCEEALIGLWREEMMLDAGVEPLDPGA